LIRLRTRYRHSQLTRDKLILEDARQLSAAGRGACTEFFARTERARASRLHGADARPCYFADIIPPGFEFRTRTSAMRQRLAAPPPATQNECRPHNPLLKAAKDPLPLRFGAET
jgi:hypothetical protein